MSQNTPLSKRAGLARFAPSTRCSRELPKCAACRPWPGDCVYHRLSPTTQPAQPPSVDDSTKPPSTFSQNINNVDQRLSRVEKALDTLSDAINASLTPSTASRGVSDASYMSSHPDVDVLTPRSRIGEDAPELFLDDAHSFSYLYDLLLTIIFNPAAVPQKAWIVYVDFILLTLLQHDPSQADTVESLKKNTDKALNDFRIFLEPSEINVQALMLLGCHGEQYASPNLSWMLVGHACRQAQALGLHKAGGRGSYVQQQRQLAIFWSLFSVDKSCSLAFGRPMLLPTAIYEGVPLPDFQYLLGYHPHRNQPVPTRGGSHTSTFGAHFFIQGMRLAQLTGAVLSLLASPGTATDHETLATKLQSWDSTTNELLLRILNTESTSSTPHQVQEMTIGVRAMRFQYLHILILLLRNVPSSKTRRVQAARDAIMLLPDLVSNSNHVYNGLVWQLLYYPFTPFFTLFGHIMDHPSAPTTQQDLHLLTTTATYFNSMKEFGSQPAVSSKLEKTALVFCNLASFVTSGENTKQDAQDLQSTATTTSSEDSATAQHSPEEPIPSLGASSGEPGCGSYGNAFMAYLDYSAQSGLDNTDVESLLGCLDSEGPLPRKRKRSYENTMDWFCWDTYYCKDER
ncbi:hypothetical protein V8C26DRAFT_436739 [Trichoderma gracile]